MTPVQRGHGKDGYMRLAVFKKQSECLLVFQCVNQFLFQLLGGILMLAAMTLQAQESVHPWPINGEQEQLHIDAIRLHKTRRFNANSPATMSALSPSPTHACPYASDIAKKPPFKTVSLTFDDGPSPGRTEFVLSILEKYNIQGAFFLIGQSAKKHPELVRKIALSGRHLIGNHSWEHPNFHDIEVERQNAEIAQAEQELSAYTQEKYFRYPYGNSTCESNAFLRQMDYKIVGWHVDSCDWAFDKTGRVSEHDSQICEVKPHNLSNFINHTAETLNERGGGILLLHEIHPNTLMQLEPLIVRLLAEGFHFERVDAEQFQASMN